MGTVWFKWQYPQYPLVIMQTRYDRVYKAAAWWNDEEETKDILGDRDEKTGGTLLGCSKQGRVAFLVDVTPSSHVGAELLTVKFLKSKMTPREFAEELVEDKSLSSGHTFKLVVADIHSKSMVYISKKSQDMEVVERNDVGPGFYSITSAGIYDLASPENKHLKDRYSELLKAYENRELSMLDFVSMLMSLVPEGSGECDDGENGCFNGTTTLVVKPTGKARLNERYLENGESKYHQFDFDIEKLE